MSRGVHVGPRDAASPGAPFVSLLLPVRTTLQVLIGPIIPGFLHDEDAAALLQSPAGLELFRISSWSLS